MRRANRWLVLVMVAAGLLAKKAVDKGLKTRPWVKASLAPGSLNRSWETARRIEAFPVLKQLLSDRGAARGIEPCGRPLS